jgi:hypothetical protein
MYSALSDGMHTLAQIAGISALVCTRRRDRSDTALETFLLQQLRTIQLVYCLYTRKPLADRVVVPAIPSRSTCLDSLFELAFRVPPYLEAVDAIANDIALKSDRDILEDLVDIEHALIAWLKEFRTSYHCLGGSHSATPEGNHDTVLPLPNKSFFSLTCETLCQICLLLISECQVISRSSKLAQPQPVESSDSYAADLYRTTTALIEVASSPVCKARALRGPLHFLNRHYTERGDRVGLQWCTKMEGDVCKAAPYLYWDGLLPWTFMALTCMPG